MKNDKSGIEVMFGGEDKGMIRPANIDPEKWERLLAIARSGRCEIVLVSIPADSKDLLVDAIAAFERSLCTTIEPCDETEEDGNSR